MRTVHGSVSQRRITAASDRSSIVKAGQRTQRVSNNRTPVYAAWACCAPHPIGVTGPSGECHPSKRRHQSIIPTSARALDSSFGVS